MLGGLWLLACVNGQATTRGDALGRRPREPAFEQANGAEPLDRAARERPLDEGRRGLAQVG